MSAFTSLIVTTDQLIPPGVWTVLRFDTESTDAPGWHTCSDLEDPCSALITPDVTATGFLAAMVQWASATGMATPPTQYLSRFVRDPFGTPDSTATGDRAPTPGAQFERFCWPIVVRDGQPLAVAVNHNGSDPLAVTLAEFKVWVP